MTEKGISGLLGIYVDDFMISGSSAVVSSGIAAIQKVWETSKPKCASEGVHFLGVDIRVQDGVYTMSQESYVQELLQRHEGVQGISLIPYPPQKDPEELEEVDLQRVREAQGFIGELTWLCTRTRVDIAWAVNKAAQLSAKRPQRAIRVCHFIIRYVRQVPDLALIYQEMRATQPHSESESLIETYTDASFAPSGERSQSGAVVLWAGGVLAWLSTRQTFVTLSSAESELCAALEGMALTYAVQDLVCELSTFEPPILLCDNIAAVSLILLPAGSWRTRHLRLRARYLHEQVEEGRLLCRHVKGEIMLADALTQHMGFDSPAVRALRLLVFASCLSLSKAQPESPNEGFEYAVLFAVMVLGIVIFKVLAMCLQYLWGVCRARWRRQGRMCITASVPSEGHRGRLSQEPATASEGQSRPDATVVRRRPSQATGSSGSAGNAPDYQPNPASRAPSEGTSNLLDGTQALLGSEAEVFDRWYELAMEQSDPYHPFADLSPSQYAGSERLPTPESSSSQRSSNVSVESPKAAPKTGSCGPLQESASSQSSTVALSSSSVPGKVVPKQPPAKHALLGLQDPLQQLRLLGVSPEDWDDQMLIGHRVVTFGRDRFEHLPIQGVLVRWHSQWRVQRFDPRVAALPIPIERFAGLRRSYCTFRDGRQCIYIDDFRQATRGSTFGSQQWRGRPELLILREDVGPSQAAPAQPAVLIPPKLPGPTHPIAKGVQAKFPSPPPKSPANP